MDVGFDESYRNWYSGRKTHAWAGFSGLVLSLTVYCSDSFSLLFSKNGSLAST